jgi:hypothetical protein
MKKSLLTLAAIAISFVGFGQSSSHVRPGAKSLSFDAYKKSVATAEQTMEVGNASSSTTPTPSSARLGNPNQTSSTVCAVTPIGHSSNALGASGGGRTQVWWDQDLNTVVYTHRGLCGTPPTVMNTGYYVYDVSTNGGTTWLADQGPIFGGLSNYSTGCTALGPHRGRFPAGVVYNPSGNTDPNNAHIAYTGVWNTQVGANTNWYGEVYGTGNLNGAPAIEHYDSLPGTAHWGEDIFVTKQGVVWKVAEVGDQSANFVYQDTLALSKGVWNGTDFTYTYYPIYYITNSTSPNTVGITDVNIAFGDDGLTGYIALIGNQDITNSCYQDTLFYMEVMKTTDGGQTWSCPVDLDIRTCLDAALIGQGNDTYASSWDLDIVVDKNNNPHIINTIVPKAGAGTVYLGYNYGTYGIFDFYSSDQGNSWKAQLLSHPQTYVGQWGTAGNDQITEFQRPFVSRTWDGSKVYFGWFDTDTATFFIYDNLSPDLRLCAYDVDNNKWTADLSNLAAINGGENITAGTFADGACILGEGPYYVKEGGPTPSVPVVYGVMGTTPSDPVSWYYVDCASPTGDFIYNGNALDVTIGHCSPLCIDGSGVVLSVKDLSSGLMVSSNYPNPFTGKTSVDVTLAKAGDVSVEISNVVGQKLVSTTYNNLHSGLNTITVDGSSLAHGLYFYTVKAGGASVTKTMTVE